MGDGWSKQFGFAHCGAPPWRLPLQEFAPATNEEYTLMYY